MRRFPFIPFGNRAPFFSRRFFRRITVSAALSALFPAGFQRMKKRPPESDLFVCKFLDSMMPLGGFTLHGVCGILLEGNGCFAQMYGTIFRMFFMRLASSSTTNGVRAIGTTSAMPIHRTQKA